MSALGDRVVDARVLDLFAGSGALGLECLSRGAREVVFVERTREALRILRKNVEELEAGARVRVVAGDAVAFAEGLEPGAFDLVLADPPYGEGLAAHLLRRFRQVPFAEELWVEHRTSEDLPDIEGLRTRRYGDTSITIIEAPE
jgi:16S rRNA (guanine966-N2)-methyltransferase